MSVDDARDVNLDRLLTDWLEADAAPRAPESLETAFVEGVASTRQRPAWATTERWISMETRAQLGVMPRAVIVLLTIALLAIGAVAGYAIGSSLVKADDGSDVAAGLTYLAPPGAIYTHPTGTGDPVRLTPDDEFTYGFAWSPDGTRFAYGSIADPQGGPITIMIRDADGSNPIAVSEPFEEANGNFTPVRYIWSPDGTRVIFWAEDPEAVDQVMPWPCGLGGTFCGQRIWITATDGSEPARIIGDPALDARSPVWTPDGESIIFTGSAAGTGTDYGIYRMDADGANAERIGDLTGSAFAFELHAISPDGTMAAVSSGDAQYDLYLVDLATGEHVLVVGGEGEAAGPYWSPDGSLIAFGIWPNNPSGPQGMLYDVASGEVISLDMPLDPTGWSPDGNSILSGWPQGTPTVVDVTDPSAPVATEIEGLIEAYGPSWQPRP
jgi:Tol biopolymer transport system component